MHPHRTTNATKQQAEQQLLGKRLPGGTPAWDPRTLCAFVGVSGVYNVHDMADYLHSRGLYRPLFERIQSLEGQPALKVLSPSYIVLDLGAEYSRCAMQCLCAARLCMVVVRVCCSRVIAVNHASLRGWCLVCNHIIPIELHAYPALSWLWLVWVHFGCGW